MSEKLDLELEIAYLGDGQIYGQVERVLGRPCFIHLEMTLI